MCIAAWIWQAHPQHQLLLLLNRDEFHGRPAKAVGWWGDGSMQILGGMDVLGVGTWMGCTKDGRLAFLTNVLEPDEVPGARSRGYLPLRYLQSNKSPLEIATDVAKEAGEYNGFNLILADLTTNVMIYVSNWPKGQPARIQLVPPGLHVLSSARLDSPWQKAIRLGKNFRELLMKNGDNEVEAKDIAQRLMTDTTRADKDRLPNTGCDPNWEHGLSSIFNEVQTDQIGRTDLLYLGFSRSCPGEGRYGFWEAHRRDCSQRSYDYFLCFGDLYDFFLDTTASHNNDAQSTNFKKKENKEKFSCFVCGEVGH